MTDKGAGNYFQLETRFFSAGKSGRGQGLKLAVFGSGRCSRTQSDMSFCRGLRCEKCLPGRDVPWFFRENIRENTCFLLTQKHDGLYVRLVLSRNTHHE